MPQTKMIMKNLFLVRTYQTSKKHFWFFVVFILFQVFFIYKGVETVPFFNYGMYSDPAVQELEYELPEYLVNGESINPLDLPMLAHNMIFKTTMRYAFLKNRNFNDPILKTINNRFRGPLEKYKTHAINKLVNARSLETTFPKWLAAYLQQRLGKKIVQLDVYLNTYQYSHDHVPELVDHALLFSFSAP